jgi:hypothetical protein
MTESEGDRSSLLPILVAAAVVAIVLITISALRWVQRDEIADEAAMGRAVIGQNDALQREDYPAFLRFTCAELGGSEAQVLGAQRQSVTDKGARFVDDMIGVAVTDNRATANVVYHFERSPDDKISTPADFVKENGEWKVCSLGPR